MLSKSTYLVGIAIAISIFAIAIFSGSEDIRACVCVQVDPAEMFDEASVVFVGEVVVRGEAKRFKSAYCDGSNLVVERNSCGEPYLVQFRVSTVWKGTVSETIYVSSIDACGYEFVEGKTYVVYASGSEGVPYVLGSVTSSAAERLTRSLGQGRKPDSGSSEPTPTPAPTIPEGCPTATPEIAPTPVPVTTLTPESTPNATQQSSPGGSCNVIAESDDVPLDAAPVALVAGIVWFRFRRRWPG